MLNPLQAILKRAPQAGTLDNRVLPRVLILEVLDVVFQRGLGYVERKIAGFCVGLLKCVQKVLDFPGVSASVLRQPNSRKGDTSQPLGGTKPTLLPDRLW